MIQDGTCSVILDYQVHDNICCQNKVLVNQSGATEKEFENKPEVFDAIHFEGITIKKYHMDTVRNNVNMFLHYKS